MFLQFEGDILPLQTMLTLSHFWNTKFFVGDNKADVEISVGL